MARKPKAYVLDSWAVLAYLEDEPAGEQVANLIAESHEQEIPLYMSIVNVGEVWYILARAMGAAEADKAVETLHRLGIEKVDANWKSTKQAAAFKAQHRMSYADCFAAALAKETNADLITGDREFSQVEPGIRVRWLAN